MEIKPYDFVAIGDGSFTSLADGKPTQSSRALAFTAEDIVVAKESGYQKGFEEGVAEGIQKGKEEKFALDQTISIILSEIKEKQAAFFSAYDAAFESFSSTSSYLSLAIAKKIAGAALKEDPTHNIEDMVKQCMKFIFNEPEVVITVNAAYIERLEEKLNAILENEYKGTVIFRSGDIPETDCLIEWKNGGAELNTAETWKKIEEVVKSH